MPRLSDQWCPGALDLQQLLFDARAGDVDGRAHLGQLLETGRLAVVAQPQALPQHFTHGVTDRIFSFIADDRLDLRPGGAQPRFQCIGGVQQLPHGVPALGRHPSQQQDGDPGNGDCHHE